MTMPPKELTKALRLMGYRHMGNGIWGKPVGYHLLTVRMSDDEAHFSNHFKGVPGKVLLWSSHKLEVYNKDYLDAIKVAEFSTRIDVGLRPSSFEFLSREEQLSDLL